jgi:Mg/Co/Ni transporter MgtE
MAKKEYSFRVVVATGIIIGIIFGVILGSVAFSFSGGNVIIGGFTFVAVLVLATWATVVGMKDQTKR